MYTRGYIRGSVGIRSSTNRFPNVINGSANNIISETNEPDRLSGIASSDVTLLPAPILIRNFGLRRARPTRLNVSNIRFTNYRVFTTIFVSVLNFLCSEWPNHRPFFSVLVNMVFLLSRRAGRIPLASDEWWWRAKQRMTLELEHEYPSLCPQRPNLNVTCWR